MKPRSESSALLLDVSMCSPPPLGNKRFGSDIAVSGLHPRLRGLAAEAPYLPESRAIQPIAGDRMILSLRTNGTRHTRTQLMQLKARSASKLYAATQSQLSSTSKARAKSSTDGERSDAP